jgi:hypothetical protein
MYRILNIVASRFVFEASFTRLWLSYVPSEMSLWRLYLYLEHAGRVHLLYLFNKGDQADLSPD